MPKVVKNKKNSTKPSQGSLRASNSVQNHREGCGITLCRFQKRSTGQGSGDRSEPSFMFASNGIHTKSRADNLQGHGLGRSPGASQVSIRRLTKRSS